MVSMLRTELTVSLEDAGTNGICQKKYSNNMLSKQFPGLFLGKWLPWSGKTMKFVLKVKKEIHSGALFSIN